MIKIVQKPKGAKQELSVAYVYPKNAKRRAITTSQSPYVPRKPRSNYVGSPISIWKCTWALIVKVEYTYISYNRVDRALSASKAACARMFNAF